MDAEVYADMVPWLVFFVVDRRSGPSVAWAAGCAALTALGLVAWAYWRGRSAPLPWIAIVVFAAAFGAGLGSPTWDHLVGTTRAAAAASLGVAALVSLRLTPLSDAYTALLVAPARRHDPGFVRVNRQISRSWAIGSCAVAASCAASDVVRSRVTFTLLDWVIPLAVACATILWTTRRVELYRLLIDTPRGRCGSEALASAAVLPAVLEAQRCGDGGDAAPDSADAVIRQLPIRRRGGL